MRPWPWLRAEAHAREAAPQEACGLFAVVRGREQYIRCRNIALAPEVNFAIDPLDWARVEDRGQITAVFHSHPSTSATPTPADRAACDQLGMPWRVFSPVASQWFTMLPAGWREPLEGRDWRWGEADCWSLVRDWFWLERRIELPDWQRPSVAEFVAAPMFDGCWREAGFTEAADEIQIGDCILFDRRGIGSDHVAVYVGDSMILHHVVGEKSRRELYGPKWTSATKIRLRHDSTA